MGEVEPEDRLGDALGALPEVHLREFGAMAARMAARGPGAGFVEVNPVWDALARLAAKYEIAAADARHELVILTGRVAQIDPDTMQIIEPPEEPCP